MMPHPLTLPTLGIMALVGAGLGTYLGKAAIGEINPAYFSDPPTRFHADLTPFGGPAGPSTYVARRDDGQGLGSGCIGCRTYPEEYYPIHEASIDSYDSGWAATAEAPVQLASMEQEPAEEAARRQAGLEQVQRYASAAVIQEAEAETAAAPAEATEAPTAE